MNFNLNIKDNTVEFICLQDKIPVPDNISLDLTLISSFESFPDEQTIKIENGKKIVYASSFQQGNSAEEIFIQKCKAKGWVHVPTSLMDDKVRRIDVVMKIGEEYLLIDVKAAKRLNRSDKDVQYRYHWFELHALGSLFSGESRMMALEIDDGKFALFTKKDVQQWIKPKLQNQIPVMNSKQALYRPYQREGRLKEWITLVDVKDIMHLCKGII